MISLSIQRRILYVPVINAAIIFLFLTNVLFCGLPLKLQFKTAFGIMGGAIIGFLLFKVIGLIPNGGILGIFISYGVLVFIGWWLICVQKELGVHD